MTASRRAAILAGPNRWRTALHLLVTTGLLVAAGVVAVRVREPVVVVGAWLLAACVLFDLLRTIHEAILPHRVLADGRGLELSWAVKRPFSPLMRRESTAIAWEELAGVRTHTLSVNGIGSTDLQVERRDGPDLRIGLVPPRDRHLVLDADGLAIGPDPARLDRIGWDAVLFARPHVVNGTTVRVRIATEDREIAAFGDWGIPLEVLAALVDPPRQAAARVHELVAQGVAFDDAVRRAGLIHPADLPIAAPS